MRRLTIVPVNYDEAVLRETQPYRATMSFLRELLRTRVMAVLEGEPGVGKTFGALSFARKHNIPFITIVERVVLEKSPSRFFRTIVAEITGREPVSLWDALDMLEQWASNSGPRQLFLDEAQWLTGKALDAFRRLHDMTGCGILFIGHQGELSRLFSRYPQAKDRVAMRFVVPPLSWEDYKLLHGNDFAEETLRTIYDLTQGNFRRLRRVVEHVFAICRVRGRPPQELTPSDIRAVTKTLIVEW